MEVSGTQMLPDVLHRHARKHPDKEVVVFEDEAGRIERITYAAFAARVNGLANALVEAGVQAGNNVAVMLTNSPEFLVSWLAINQAGAVIVPVNVFYAADELQYLINSSDSVAFITEPRFLPLFERVAPACPGLSFKVLAKAQAPASGFRTLASIGASADVRIVRVAPEAPAQIVYTSGTTSRPKGAVISHKSTLIQGIALAQQFAMTNAERTCVVLPLFHVNGQYVTAIPTLTVGGTIVLLETFSARKFWSQVRTHRCTFMSIVPMLLRTILAQPPREDDADHCVRLCFYALPTTEEEWEAFETRFRVPLVEGYGLSETLGICTCNPVAHGFIKRHCIGPPVLGRQVRVVDESFRDVPTGQVGRILVRGEPLFSGYYRNEAATAACMIDGWLDTGDNGSLDADGYLHFFDRSKDVIKRAGENIAATEVERVLNEHPKIADAAVIGVHDPLRDEAVKAFVVVREGETLAEAEITEWCLAHLARFKVPTVYEFRQALPKTSIGKIMKHVLKAEEKHGQSQGR